MKKWLKRTGWMVAIPFLMMFVVSVLLYVPVVQDFVVRQATRYASHSTGMQIGIERIRLSFPLRLHVHGVEVIQAEADTLLVLNDLDVHIRPWPLFNREVLVEAIRLHEVQVDTRELIEGFVLKGAIGELYVQADRINLASEHATLNQLLLSDATLTLLLTDTTTQKDTVSSAPLPWSFSLEKIDLERVALAMQMPADSLRIAGFIEEANLREGTVDLSKAHYEVASFHLDAPHFQYITGEQPVLSGFDPSHVVLSDFQLDAVSLAYDSTTLQARLEKLMVKERCGLEISRLEGNIEGNLPNLRIPGFSLETPHSNMRLQAGIPFDAFAEKPKGEMDIQMDALIGKQDVLAFLGELPQEAIDAYPEQAMRLRAKLTGNMETLRLEQIDLQLPQAFHFHTRGEAYSLLDTKKRRGSLLLDAQTNDLTFLLDLLPETTRQNLAIPNPMTLKGKADIQGETYRANLLWQEAEGKIHLQATYDQPREYYHVHLNIDSLQPNHFLPHDSLYQLSATLQAEGERLNLFDSLAWAKLDMQLSDIHYGSRTFADVSVKGALEKHFAQLDLVSHYPLAKMDISLNATLKEQDVKGMMIADIQHVDLQGLHLSEQPLATSFQLFAELETDLKEKYLADLTLGNWEIQTAKQTARPKTLILKAQTSVDSTFVSFHAGDLSLELAGNSGLQGLSKDFDLISREINRQMTQDSVIRLALVRPMLPEMYLEMKARKDNPIYNFLQLYGMNFQRMNFRAYTSPETGIRMDGEVLQLLRDTFLLDTIQMHVWQDTVGIFYQAGIVKNKFQKQAPFSVDVSGQLQTGFMDALLHFRNGQGKTGILLGARLSKEDEGGMKIHLFPDEPILAFSPFSVNPDNYIIFRDEKNIEANLLLQGKAGTFLRIYNENPEGNQRKIQAELGEIDLLAISNAFSSYLPRIGGKLYADVQYMPSDSSFMLTANMNVDSLSYEKEMVGNLLFSSVYLPVSKTEHQIDMHLFRNAQEILNASAYYQGGEPDEIQGSLSILQLPLEMANPFIPDGMARLCGTLSGELSLAGSSSQPDLEGSFQLDSSQIYIELANTTIRLDNKSIAVRDNRILFNKYGFYAHGENPFVIDGNIDLGNFSSMYADLKLSAQNMQLLNTKRNKNSLVYGRMFVNLASTIQGSLNALKMRGDLDLLGGTNVTYILQDSPLTVQDRLSGLVTFTSFDEDTLLVRRPRRASLPLGGMDMLMTIHIDQAVQVNVDLTPDQSSHVNLEGGGDLSFQYTPMGDMILNGRYTLTSGTFKYALPVIPLKEFNVENGSYIQWNGNPMDPILNITATERIRTSVAADEQSSRMVNFDVGIELTQRLENLGLKFILEAPEDAAMQEELARMGEEERAKQAVSMLVTGMYLGGGTTTGKANLDMGAALNSFLQNEINNLAGSLKGVDLNFGMESYDEDGDGSKRTDYSFRFAKRFYNDRIRIVLGGRISTGADINQGQAQPFIDNVSIEYRLDPSGTRYVKIFHNKDYESLLEGELTETGAGIVLHKKMQHMRELFIFKKNKVKPVNEEEADESED